MQLSFLIIRTGAWYRLLVARARGGVTKINLESQTRERQCNKRGFTTEKSRQVAMETYMYSEKCMYNEGVVTITLQCIFNAGSN